MIALNSRREETTKKPKPQPYFCNPEKWRMVPKVLSLHSMRLIETPIYMGAQYHGKLSLKNSNLRTQPPRKSWGFQGHVRIQNIKITFSFGISHELVLWHEILVLVGFCGGVFFPLCWWIYETFRVHNPYCNVTTFLMIDCKSLHRVPRSLVGSRSLNKIKTLPMFCL